MSKWLTVQEASEYLKVERSTIYRRVKNKQMQQRRYKGTQQVLLEESNKSDAPDVAPDVANDVAHATNNATTTPPPAVVSESLFKETMAAKDAQFAKLQSDYTELNKIIADQIKQFTRQMEIANEERKMLTSNRVASMQQNATDATIVQHDTQQESPKEPVIVVEKVVAVDVAPTQQAEKPVQATTEASSKPVNKESRWTRPFWEMFKK